MHNCGAAFARSLAAAQRGADIITNRFDVIVDSHPETMPTLSRYLVHIL